MNPFGAGAVMLSFLDEDSTKDDVRIVANKSGKAILISTVIAFLLGTYIFQFFGISAHSLRTFGGLILLMMGLSMVQGRNKKINASDKERDAAKIKEDISVVPLSIPIIVGPGYITTLITASSEANSTWHYYGAIIGIFIATFFCYLILRNMISIKQKLGVNGLRIFTRVIGLVVGSIGAQMIIHGIKALWV